MEGIETTKPGNLPGCGKKKVILVRYVPLFLFYQNLSCRMPDTFLLAYTM